MYTTKKISFKDKILLLIILGLIILYARVEYLTALH